MRGLATTLLDGTDVTRRFGGVAALSHVDFHVHRGEILGVIGPNGSGKTTLLNVISGIFPLSGGTINFKGQRLNGLKPHVIGRMGIARTFQVVKPFGGLTVQENVAVGALFCQPERPRMGEALEKAEDALESVGLWHRRNAAPSELTTSDRKRLELARALATGAEMVLLDEVMAGLNHKEVDKTMDLIRQLHARGLTIVIIEHLMKTIMGLSDRIMVLHHGEKIADDVPQVVVNDETVIKAYLGERYTRARQSRVSEE